MPDRSAIIPPHGGFRDTKTFQLATVIYDVTVLFCDKYVDRYSRTRDQMVQAARSWRQNIAEGSIDSATSRKMELKLTGVAKGSLGELALDYEDFLRQRELPQWAPDHPALMRLKALRCNSLVCFRGWVAKEVAHSKNTDDHGPSPSVTAERGRANSCRSVLVGVSPCHSTYPSVLAANGALSLLNLCTFLLDRQMQTPAKAFEEEGGFTERLYRVRSRTRGTVR